MKRIILCITLALTLFSFNFSAQKDEESRSKQQIALQHEIIVTATRLETSSKEIASSVTVITKEELEQTKKTTILEALQEIMGLTFVQSGSSGGAASVSLRGANSEHTLLMVDGVELNDPISPSRSFDFAHLSLENIDRIEILRGPQSTLYGSDAIAGVINVITKNGDGTPTLSLSGWGGTYNTLATRAEISGSTEKIHYALGFSSFNNKGPSAANDSYEGNSERDSYKNLSLSARFGARLGDGIEFNLILRGLNAKSDVDNFGGAYGDDPNNTQKNKSLLLKADLRSLWLENRWEQILSFSLVSNDRRNENLPDTAHPFDSENGWFKSRFLKIDWQHNLYLHETNTLTFGLDHKREQGESEYISMGTWGPSKSMFPLQKAHTTGFYLQDQIRLFSRFFATAGIRLDSHSPFGRQSTFRIAPAYFFEKTGTKFKATYGTAFKAPSLYQLYAPGTLWGPIGNDNLKPEKSTGWDIGVEQNFFGSKMLLGFTYFSNTFKDLIQYYSAQGYINLAKAQSKGKELFMRVGILEGMNLNTSFTQLEAIDSDSGARLLRRPNNKFSATLNYSFLQKGNASLSLLHIGKREDMDYSMWPPQQVTLPAYTLVNAVCSFDLTPLFQVFIRLDNIFNEYYEMIKGYGTPGFSVFGGLKFSY